jgi:hypothetical protein
MMAEQHCFYPDRESALVAYLYDDIDTVQRVAFETHVATCEPCRTELAEFRGVRSQLAQWAAPESTRRSLQSPVPSPQSRWWHDIPAWAQVAAALLVLGVSASIANLDIRYGRTSGLTITTGWSKPAAPAAVAVAPAANATPWRAELAAVQKQLRDEMHAQSASLTKAAAAVPAAAMSDAEFRSRLRPVLDESEQSQKKDFASKLVQLQRDMYAQEQYDHARIYQTLGAVQSSTRAVAARQQQVNMLLAPKEQR